MDWRDRFRAPTVRTAEVARDRPERGVVISDQDGAFQACGWHVAGGELRPVTAGDSATIHAAISHDGEWIFYLESTKREPRSATSTGCRSEEVRHRT